MSLFSCRGNKKQEVHKTNQPYYHKTLSIPLDSLSSSEPNKVQLIESDSGDYIVAINKLLPSIDFYSIKTLKKERSILFFKDGINKIGTLTGFQIFSKDTILVTSAPATISLFDFKGSKNAEFRVQGENQYIQTINSNNKTPLLFHDSFIFGAYPFFTRFWEVSNKSALKINLAFKLNMLSGEINWIPINIPENFWGNGRISPSFQWSQRGDSIVTVLESEPTIRIFSISKNHFIETKALPTMYKITQKGMTTPPEGNKGIQSQLGQGNMNVILYDKYRDVFYCFYHIPIDPDKYSFKLIDLFLHKPKVGMLILDKNLNLLEEIIFNDFEVDDLNSFVGKEGLFISSNHPLKDDYNENILKYHILRFKSLQYED